MRLPLRNALAPALSGVAVLSCSDPTLAPVLPRPHFDLGLTPNAIVISQVYGGGGNSGAVFKNDFIELFNPGSNPVNVTGWSVQYASATGTSWQVTALTGTIQPGGYYLVQEAAGTGGTTSLPTPEASGGIAMAAGAGKVWLATQTTALSTACPNGANVIDGVSYGTTASNCGFGTTATLTNTTAALRGGNGCTYTGALGSDFATGAPTPRNSASPTNTCGVVTPQPETVTLNPDSTDVNTGSTVTFSAAAKDINGNPVATTFTWGSSDNGIATVNASGVASGVAGGTVTITATTPNGKVGTARLRVIVPPPPPPPADVVISQIYGGGGNSGAPYSNDFVELFNRGATTADVAGWTIQYTSSAGTTWGSNVATLPAGATIQPGAHFLVQLSAGAGTAAPLPTPDATGAINMSSTSGKVILAQPGIATSVACPAGAGIVDAVGYGTASNCGATWGGTTPNVSNTTAAFRKNDGCTKTGSVSADFVVLAPNPRNSGAPVKNCSQPPRPQSSATIAINELMGDPANAESASWGQWFEVKNYGGAPVDLFGWTIISDGTSQPDHVINAHLVVPAGGYAVLGRGADITRNGGVNEDYNYFTGGSTTIWLDPSDFLMLVDGAGARVDSVAWTSLPHGVTKGLYDATVPHANADGGTWGYSTTVFGDGDYGTPGADNAPLATTPPFVSPNTITVSGRVATDAPLPVGFESQLFATELDGANQPITTTFTWSSLTPSIGTIDARGVIRALSAGQARFHVVAADGATRVHTLTFADPVASITALYGNNTEFGDPTDADASDDYIVRRPQYTTSWNPNRHIPNWVGYDLDASHIQAGQDRCNCFTFDPVLEAAGFPRYNTADYTGAGAFAGYGIDRGHLTRSFDRTSGTLDNAVTFYFSNVVPQASDLNQGPWAVMENDLGALATAQNREVYILAGAVGSKGTVKNEGLITIPAQMWKVALIMNRDQGLADVHTWQDVQVIAVIMPNDPGVRNVDWHTYTTTVDAVEALSGYDLLALLPDQVEIAVESNTRPPVAAVDGPYASAEGSSVAMSAAGSSDPDGDALTFAWDFGDGGTATGTATSHTYTHNGTFTVTLTATDIRGLNNTVTTTAVVSNVAPVIAPFAGASLLVGEVYTASGSFTDPGADTWNATVDYGDGTGTGTLGLGGMTFSLTHQYTTPGSFTVTVSVNDGDDVATASASVTVLSAVQGIAQLQGMVDQLYTSGKLNRGNTNSLNAKLGAALESVQRGQNGAAGNQLNALVNQLNAMVREHLLTAADAAPLLDMATRVIATLAP